MAIVSGSSANHEPALAYLPQAVEEDFSTAYAPGAASICLADASPAHAATGSQASVRPTNASLFGPAHGSGAPRADHANGLTDTLASWMDKLGKLIGVGDDDAAATDKTTSTVTVNGRDVELPKEYAEGAIVNGRVFLTKDAAKYAWVPDEGAPTFGTSADTLDLGETPNEKVHIERHGGTTVLTSEGGGQARSAGTSRSTITFLPQGGVMVGALADAGGNINVSNNTVSSGSNNTIAFGGGRNIVVHSVAASAPHIDKRYSGVDTLTVTAKHQQIELSVSTDDSVHVEGTAKSPPWHRGSSLDLDNFDGELAVPRNTKLNIQASYTNISGTVAQPGSISTSYKPVDLNLAAPLTVDASTGHGEVNAFNMVQKKDGTFAPPRAQAEGTLTIRNANGPIHVDYLGK